MKDSTTAEKSKIAFAKPFHVRTQNDGEQRAYSLLARIDTGPDTPTRQEFAEEADINNILMKYGAAPQRPFEGDKEIDYNLDLQQAYEALEQVSKTNFNVPAELRQKYPTWRHVLTAVETGQYEYDLKALDTHRKRTEAAKKAAENAAKATPEPSPKG